MKNYLFILISFLSNVTSAQINNIQKSTVTPSSLRPSETYFRITAKGMICNRQTDDDMLERDGKGDEIYLAVTSVMVGANGISLPQTLLKTRSRTFGDINGRESYERRAMAGSAPGNLGGIVSGDQLPDVNPWKNNAPAKGDLLPFVIWEGDLTNNQSVMITPSLMEWDGPADFLTNFWHNSFVGQLARIPVALVSTPYTLATQGINAHNDIGVYDDGSPGVFAPPTVQQNLISNFFKVDYKSMTNESRERYKKENYVDLGKPNDRPIGVSENVYNPLYIVLNASSFAKIASKDFGYGKGIIPIKYKDASGANGDYTVFYYFEKITTASEKSRINVTSTDAFHPSVAYRFQNAAAPGFTTDLLNGGNVVVMNEDKGLQSEKWLLKKSNNYYFVLQNPYNNQVLNLRSAGNNVYTAETATAGRDMALIRYCDGSWIIKVKDDNAKVMQTAGENIAIATPVLFGIYRGAKSQRWFVEE